MIMDFIKEEVFRKWLKLVPRPGKGGIRGWSLGAHGQLHSPKIHNTINHDQPSANPMDTQDAFNHSMFMSGKLVFLKSRIQGQIYKIQAIF